METVLSDAGYDGDGVLVVGDGDPTAKTKMICGHLSFRDAADHPILRALPDYQIMTASMRAKNIMFDEIVRMLARRVFAGNPIGMAASIIRLSEIMFIEFLKTQVESNEAMENVLMAFSDVQIGLSLTLMHTKPEHHWSVDALASEIGMSRSRFANRFQSLMGTGPMSYLSDWRLQKALTLLSESKKTVQQIAAISGYQSAAAFTRAFADKFGVAPTQYRKSTNHAYRPA